MKEGGEFSFRLPRLFLPADADQDMQAHFEQIDPRQPQRKHEPIVGEKTNGKSERGVTKVLSCHPSAGHRGIAAAIAAAAARLARDENISRSSPGWRLSLGIRQPCLNDPESRRGRLLGVRSTMASKRRECDST